MDNYYVIYLSEDGDGSIRRCTKEELLKNISEEYWGSVEPLPIEASGIQIGEKSGVMFIKGEQVYPVPKQVVETWDID